MVVERIPIEQPSMESSYVFFFFFRGLKVTATFAPENEWLEYDPTSFWGSFGLFSGGRCLLLVSGSVLDQNDRNTLLPQPRWVLFFVH